MEEKYGQLMKEMSENQPPKMQQFYQRLDELLSPDGKDLLSNSKEHFRSLENIPRPKRRKLGKMEENL